MISAKSIKWCLIMNTMLLFIGITQYTLLSSQNTWNAPHAHYTTLSEMYTTAMVYFSAFMWRLLVIAARNYLLIYLINIGTRDCKSIDSHRRLEPKETYFGEFHIYAIQAAVVETGTFIPSMLFLTNAHNVMFDLLFFIPVSFAYELIFDFFHYWTHRSLHANKTLYQMLHKKHHKFQYPTALVTYYQHAGDLVLTNSIPNILTLYLLNLVGITITTFTFNLILVYKMYIEISGHIGKDIKVSSFIQCNWLSRLLHIELYVKDHDLHHSQNNCNYAKRFALWDKAFGTTANSDPH